MVIYLNIAFYFICWLSMIHPDNKWYLITEQSKTRRSKASRAMASSQSEDEYMSQLQDVFNSCVEGGSGTLGRSQLQELLHKLQLEEYSKDILPQLLGSESDRKVWLSFVVSIHETKLLFFFIFINFKISVFHKWQVSFNEFKDVFVKLLCQIMADQDGSLPSRSNTPSPVISLDEGQYETPQN